MFSKISLSTVRRYLVTLAVVLAALFIGWRLWIHYENDPWTRDGRIKADVVQVAPDVSGQVTKINVIDNQTVNVGDVLFELVCSLEQREDYKYNEFKDKIPVAI